MKYFIFIFFLLFSSCKDDYKIVGGSKNDTYFKIAKFDISGNQIDLNNDNILNKNILLETSNYFNNTYDLQIKSNNTSSLFSFYFPKQNISFDYTCCPSGYVEFSKNGFTINIDKNQNIIENIVIDDENKIISLLKLNEKSYQLFFEKKYFDFSRNKFSTELYSIKYDLTN